MFNNIAKFFGVNTDPIIGIDISSSAIKLLELSERNNKYKVEKYFIERLPPGVVVEKNIKDTGQLISVLREVIKKSKITSRRVCLSLPSSLVITRIIQLNASLSENEIGQEIEIEADRYIPYSLDEVELDYEILGPSIKNANLVDILLAVTKTENIQNLTQILEQVGLEVAIIDVDCFAMERAFKLVANQLPDKSTNKIVAIVDIGATLITLHIFHQNKSIYNREQNFGCQQLIDEIQNRYGLTFEEARLARRYNDLPDDYIPEVLNPFKENLSQQISRASQFFFSSGEYSEIDYLLLTGGGSSIPGLDMLLQEQMGVKTFIANPFLDMGVSPKINHDLLNKEADAMMICCGLALRNVVDK